jgi:hypothetical protein
MADALLDQQAASSLTTAAGQGGFFFDNQTGLFLYKDAAGRTYGQTDNGSIAAQGAGFNADTYLTDSDLKIPSCSFQVRSKFFWRISASKTAAGVATPAYNIRIGSNRTTADTARLTLTGPAQTAIADIGTLNIMVIVRSLGAAGVIQGTAWWDHRGTAVSSTIGVGFANDGTGHVEGTSAGFDNSALSGQFIGLSLNGGASAAWTVTQVQAQAQW